MYTCKYLCAHTSVDMSVCMPYVLFIVKISKFFGEVLNRPDKGSFDQLGEKRTNLSKSGVWQIPSLPLSLAVKKKK